MVSYSTTTSPDKHTFAVQRLSTYLEHAARSYMPLAVIAEFIQIFWNENGTDKVFLLFYFSTMESKTFYGTRSCSTIVEHQEEISFFSNRMIVVF